VRTIAATMSERVDRGQIEEQRLKHARDDDGQPQSQVTG
jgi:hypothetical protein